MAAPFDPVLRALQKPGGEDRASSGPLADPFSCCAQVGEQGEAEGDWLEDFRPGPQLKKRLPSFGRWASEESVLDLLDDVVWMDDLSDPGGSYTMMTETVA
jgi:hypothetical protein